jgi:NADPH:quinone reductase-like Zn-dependent oxidoreductase
MAQRTIVSPSHSFPIPDNIDDDIAAAIVNRGLSAWGALAWRAQLTAGETVLILGATGVTGKLAVQTAKLLGAGRVIAAWRNEQVLSTLHDLGADTTIRLDKPGQDLTSLAKLVMLASTSSSITSGALPLKHFLLPSREEIW